MAQTKGIYTLLFTLLLLSSASSTAHLVSLACSAIDFPHNQSYINTTQPTIVGSLYDEKRNPIIGQTLNIFLNETFIGSTLSDSNGTFYFLPEQKIDDGRYALTIVCVESNVTLGPHHMVIDSTLPPIEITYPTQNGLVTTRTFMIHGTTEENASVETFLDSDTYGNICYADDAGNWSVEYSAHNGLHRLTAQATDLAGNQGPMSFVRTFFVVAQT